MPDVIFLRRRRRVRLIPDWRQAWRFASVQVAAVLAALSLVQSDLLPFLAPIVPARYWPYVTAAVGCLVVICRIVQQQLPPAAKESPQ